MLDTIRKRQIEFQKFVGFPVESKLDSDRNEMAEKYLFKAMEEIIELRREFPSIMNPWSKEQKLENLQRIKEEFSDVLLFLINFANVWKLDSDEVMSMLKKVQDNNFLKVKEKKIDKLNGEMMRIPGYTIGVGQGNLFPKYVFVGQNPGETINHGYRVWNNVEDGSTRVLRPITEALGLDNEAYFTNIVKSTTIKNEKPSDDLVKFWSPFFKTELEILTAGCEHKPIIVAMGNWTADVMESLGYEVIKITHPAAILRGVKTKQEYREEVESAVAHNTGRIR